VEGARYNNNNNQGVGMVFSVLQLIGNFMGINMNIMVTSSVFFFAEGYDLRESIYGAILPSSPRVP
jgi:hypothetical protein